MNAALEYLSLFDNENKVAVLGDMGGLGKFARELHMSIVPPIKDSGVKKLFLVRLLIDKIISQKLHKPFYGLHLKIPAKKGNLI